MQGAPPWDCAWLFGCVSHGPGLPARNQYTLCCLHILDKGGAVVRQRCKQCLTRTWSERLVAPQAPHRNTARSIHIAAATYHLSTTEQSQGTAAIQHHLHADKSALLLHTTQNADMYIQVHTWQHAYTPTRPHCQYTLLRMVMCSRQVCEAGVGSSS